MKILNFIKNNPRIYMIMGIIVLIASIGVSYAYYAASTSDTTSVTGTAGGGSAPVISVELVSEEATGNLIPISMNTETLTKAASSDPKCIDNNGYTACQIYSVSVTNNSDISQSYSIDLTRLYGENTPNIEAVTMGSSNTTVTSADSIKNGNICTTNTVVNGETTDVCYFMVFIKNLESAQTDRGTFNGTVTAT